MKIFCSGIGGIGLSAYASLMKHAGHDVYGSDRSDSVLLDDLRSQGIHISLDQSGDAIPDGTELFVYSEAIPPDAPERQRAEQQGILQYSYPQALGELSKNKKVIAVCGSHGKSSTTAIAAKLMIEAGLDPTIVIGTKIQELDGRNWRQGSSEWFLLEACEYKRSFLHYSPTITLLTNADPDHLDYYNSREDYLSAFTEFISRLPTNGALITHMRDTDCRAIADKAPCPVVDADAYPLVRLQTPGEQMQHNAQLVLGLADILTIPQEEAINIISAYAGSWRRMELKGRLTPDIPLIDDYAHHPVEIRATLKALQHAYPDRRLVCVFQPHTHDRTLKLYDDFTHAFSDADLVIVPNIYDARHYIESASVNVDKFVRDIAQYSKTEVFHGISLEETKEMLQQKILQPGDLLVTMGAGDITNLATALLPHA